MLRRYNSLLLHQPYRTQAVTASILFAAGDVIAQQAIDRRGWREHDYWRTLRLTFYGGCMFSPVITKWFTILERIHLKNRYSILLTRVSLDQFVITPVLIAAFYTSQTFLEGKGIDEATLRLQKSWEPTLLRNWLLFIPVQLANFSIVPPHLRLVVVNVVALFWNAYLSYANSAVAEDKVQATIELTEAQ